MDLGGYGMKTLGVIASRYASTRLPGKALKDICGRPMVWWVYNSILGAKGLDELIIATDDMRIVEECTKYNIPSIMTGTEHGEAANRLHEVSQKIDADFYIQINGDEPLLSPSHISVLIQDDIPVNEEYGVNLITKIENPVEVMDASNIKVIFDEYMNTCYMSRTPIPYPYRSIEYSYYKHIGIIGYNKKMLEFYAAHAPGRFERIEGIATLRFTDYGKILRCVEVEEKEALSVDTSMDLEHVRMTIQKKINNGELDKFKELIDKGC